ncbi:CGNR zinc finger domain-containing protein [Nocardioides panaciterrulae]|uniref:Putative RNA-binding Zn ribbon-like protein n=1 Tax=Nocardioides panaciterrulae TaxID=661492 RepID=A0A7Y9E3Q7_9ACTN|nr:CGNR zinc finger domain-containing protein [Nocardioides panaciterrulae]NYD40385.1 putative RNA-binding Zn ribbon-like protein [Nocardioides panaciterrulae]
MARGHDSDTTRLPTDPKSAPPDLEDLRTFLNTDNRYYGFDALDDTERRPLFWARWLPAFDVTGVDEEGWRRLAELRDAIRALVCREPGAAERLSRVAARHPVRLAVETRGDRPVARLVPAGNRPEAAIAATLLGAVRAALDDGRIARLRVCDRAECQWVYYDSTKNRSGRWCSSDPCGDVMKARAYRARQAAVRG